MEKMPFRDAEAVIMDVNQVITDARTVATETDWRQAPAGAQRCSMVVLRELRTLGRGLAASRC
jgi:hypothetical protein